MGMDAELQGQGLSHEMQESLCRRDSAPAPLSAWQASFTLTQNILGAGVLALPFATRSAGLLGGSGLLALIFLLTLMTMGALILLASNIGEFSYKGQAIRTMGGRWATFFEIWVLCYTLGICIGYPILLGDFVSSVLQHLHAGAWCTSPVCMVIVALAVCWPLSCAPTLGALGRLSICGVFFIASTVVIVIIRFTDGTYAGRNEGGMKALNTADFGSCFPILVGAFGAHFNVPTLFKEVAPMAGVGDYSTTAEGKAAVRRMFGVVLVSLLVCSAIYTSIGIVVYATFGDPTQADFTQNYGDGDALIIAVRCIMAFSICISFPLVMVSARSSMFEIFFKPRGWVLTTTFRIALTTFLVFFCLGIALATGGKLDLVLTYNGSVFGTPVCYIAPCLMYLRLPRVSQSRRWRAGCALGALLGVAFGVYGVVTVTLAHLHPSKAKVATFQVIPTGSGSFAL